MHPCGTLMEIMRAQFDFSCPKNYLSSLNSFFNLIFIFSGGFDSLLLVTLFWSIKGTLRNVWKQRWPHKDFGSVFL